MAQVRIKFMSTKNLKGALRAFFTADLGVLSIKGMKLLEGSNGYFLGFPSEAYEADGETKYSDFVRLARNDDGKYTSQAQTLYNQILEAALKEYEKQGGAPAKVDDTSDLPF